MPVNPMWRDVISAPNTGQLQQLRRLKRARRKDNLFIRTHSFGGLVLPIGDANGTLAFKQYLGRAGLSDDGQIGAVHHRMQICRSSGTAFTILVATMELRDLIHPNTFVIAIIKIGPEVVLIGRCGGNKGMCNWAWALLI